MRRSTAALSARNQRMPSGTTRWAAEGTVTASSGITPSATPAQSAALCPRKEMPSLIPGSRSHPADVYVPLWVGRRPAAMDMTVISPLQQLTLSGASSIAGHELQVAEERKRTAYAELCHSLKIDFVPLAIEALGGWSDNLQHYQEHFPSPGPTLGYSNSRILPSPGPANCNCSVEGKFISVGESPAIHPGLHRWSALNCYYHNYNYYNMYNCIIQYNNCCNVIIVVLC